MSCNQPQTVTERIVCARTCLTEFNVAPIALLSYENFILTDDSIYFDNNIVEDRMIRWTVKYNDDIIIQLGYGNSTDIINELANGSTYGELILGTNNSDIINYIENLPNTIVPNGTTFELTIDVMDDTGISSSNNSNKYIFTK